MAIHVEWRKSPPRYGTDDLTSLVCDYYDRRYDPTTQVYKTRDDIPEFCAEADTFAEAVRRAVRSKRPNGKHHNHQSKVRVLPAWERKLLLAENLNYMMYSCFTFHDLLVFLDRKRIPGIGPTTTYDVATRVGAWLNLEPEFLYIHAGVDMGRKALGLPPAPYQHKKRRDLRWFYPPELPAPLRSLPVNDIEDFLCCYREALTPELLERGRSKS